MNVKKEFVTCSPITDKVFYALMTRPVVAKAMIEENPNHFRRKCGCASTSNRTRMIFMIFGGREFDMKTVFQLSESLRILL